MTSPSGAILSNIGHADLQPRVFETTTVAASPATNAETTIATFTINNNVSILSGIHLVGWCAFTVGTSGVSATLKIRETGTSGTTVVTTGATTAVAGTLCTRTAVGFDPAANPTIPGQVYVLTLTIGSGGATSTVSAVYFGCLIV